VLTPQLSRALGYLFRLTSWVVGSVKLETYEGGKRQFLTALTKPLTSLVVQVPELENILHCSYLLLILNIVFDAFQIYNHLMIFIACNDIFPKCVNPMHQ